MTNTNETLEKVTAECGCDNCKCAPCACNSAVTQGCGCAPCNCGDACSCDA